MALTRTELRKIASSVGERTGWDFSRVRGELDPVPWDYVSVVRQHLSPDVRALDIGTGGGEIFLSLAAYLGAGLGVDAYPNMISAAQASLRQKSVDNTVFLLMRAEHLGLAPASFDVVLNRHAPVFPGEIVRVLRGSGVFITQHVGGRDTQNIYSAFGWGSLGDHWRRYWHERGLQPQDVDTVAGAFQAAGFEVLAQRSYDVPYYFRDVESLVFWLKSVPLPVDFDINTHWRVVSEFVDANSTARGIKTN